MSIFELPDPGEQPPPKERTPGSKRRSARIVAVAAIALLGGIAAFSQLVRQPAPDEAAEQVEEPAVEEVTEPTVQPTEPAAQPIQPEREPRIVSSRPPELDFNPNASSFYEPPTTTWQLIDGQLVSVTPSGVYVSSTITSDAVLYESPVGSSTATCLAETATSLRLVGVSDEGVLSVWDFDMDTLLWTQAPTNIYTGFTHCAASVVDGSLVVASSTSTAVEFLWFDANGAVGSQRSFRFPESWIRGSDLIYTSVAELLVAGDDVIANLCVTVGTRSECRHHFLRFSLDALYLDRPAEESFVETITPSELHASAVSTELSGVGLDPDAFSIVEVAGALWQLEWLASEEGGQWAAAPLDAVPVPITERFRPELFAFEDTVVAAAPREVLRGPTGFGTDSRDWWIFEAGTQAGGSWRAFEGAPAVPIDLEQLGSSATRISGFGESHAGPFAVLSSQIGWDDFDDTADIVVAGDRAYVESGGHVWVARGRGRVFEQVQLAPAWADGCEAIVDGTLAATIADEAGSHLIIDSDLNRRHVPFEAPFSAWFASERPTVSRPCRPVLVDDTWHVATIDHVDNSLQIFSIDPTNSVTKHRIELTGPWAELFNEQAWVGGSVDLYRDGDQIVVHVCSLNNNAQCVFTDLSFDRSLIDGASTTTTALAESQRDPALIYPANDHPYGAAEVLHQLGTALWRADTDQVLGVCVCGGEGGADGPYYQWVGGPFAGPATVPETRTVSYRLLDNRIVECGSNDIPATAYERDDPDFVEPDPQTYCAVGTEGQDVVRPLSALEQRWSDVPAGTDVNFSRRASDEQIFVVPTGGN